ncbi:MAG: hypothetical protein IPJ07_13450 [Acidobacteria bacterium]|nr:hypothetical protein [Acidobacteriota bacterium]
MMLLKSLAIWFLIGFAQAQTSTSERNIIELLNQVMSNQREMNRQITEYTALNKFTRRTFNNKGELKEEIIEVSENYQSPRRNVEVVLSRNGKPMSENKIQKERQKAVKNLTEDEAERLKTVAHSPGSSGPEFGFVFGMSKERMIRIGTFEIFRAGEFYNLRHERWNDRDMLVLDFRPNPAFRPEEHVYAPLGHLAGTVWIDAADRVTAKLQAYLAEDSERKTVAFAVEYSRMPDGIWLATLTRVNAAANPQVFNNLNYEWISEKSNYQRFSAQAGEAKIEIPRPKP